MTKFTDGPAAGQMLSLHRAPIVLRVVYNRRTKAWDALNEHDDVAKPHEDIHLYILTERAQMVHLRMSPRSSSGWYAMASYRHLADERVADDVLRDNATWRAWEDANQDRLMPEWAKKEIS